jgi:phosphoglycolate phosphatase-like HAD superfamily hydrolase
MQRESLASPQTWMVGDSAEDRSAAEGNGLRFFSATWGYGAAGPDGLRTPDELLRLVRSA